MRIAIVTESFLPDLNGVAHSVERIVEYLVARGDEVLIVAPTTASDAPVELPAGVVLRRLPSVPLPLYASIRLAGGGVSRVRRILADFAPDLVHLASPFELGWRAARAASDLKIPTIAVYQTDVPGYLVRYGFRLLEGWAWQRIRNIHRLALRTLAPSTFTVNRLRACEVPRVELWGRGVDTARFNPGKRNAALRRTLAPKGERLIGYVGRLAAEKQVDDLAVLADIPGSRLVIIGDGPQRRALEELMPEASFLGFLTGDALATAVASLDLFVHPGELETFGQTLQEAMASGLPVVATGRGGPLDLVDSSRTGWLYAPGDLDQMRRHVLDLIGDDAKRAAFSAAALDSVQARTWPVLCELLLQHYSDVMAQNAVLLSVGHAERAIDDGLRREDTSA